MLKTRIPRSLITNRTIKRLQGLWPLCLVWLALLLHFSPELFTCRTFCFIDYSRHYLPFKAYAVSALRSGLLPLWNPLVYCGFPQVGEIQVNVFYPLNIILLLGDFTRRLELFVFLHYLIAAAAAYYLGRSLCLSRGAAVLLAASYSLSGYLLLAHQVTPALCSLSYLPLVIALFYGFLKRGDLGRLFCGMVALGLQITAGYPITVYQTLLAIAVMLLVSLSLSATRRRRPVRAAQQHAPAPAQIQRSIFIGLAVFGACALSAVVLLPFLELVSLGERAGGNGLREIVPKSVTFEALKVFFSPAYFGIPTSPRYHGPVRLVWLGMYYCGPLLIFLACFAVLRAARRESYLFLALAVAGLVLMLGDSIPFSNQALTRLLPGFGAISRKGNFFSLLLVSMSTLSAIGYDEIRKRRSTRDPLPYILIALLIVPVFTILNPAQHPDLRLTTASYTLFVCLLAAALMLRRRFSGRWFGPSLILLVMLDLCLAGWANYRQDINEDFYRGARPAPLPAFSGRTHHAAGVITIHKRLWPDSYEEFLLGTEGLGLPDLNLLTATYCVVGYGSFTPRAYLEILRRVEDGEYRFAAVTRRYQLLDSGACILRNVDKEGRAPMMAEYFRHGVFRRDEGLTFERRLPGSMELATSRDGEVVVKECWHPGWKLYRTGESSFVTASAAAKALADKTADMPATPFDSVSPRSGPAANRHSIERLSGLIRFKAESGGRYLLRFEPFSFKLGLFITLLSLAVIGAILTRLIESNPPRF